MDHPFSTMRRLHARGPAARGLVVDNDGVMLGPDCVLVWRQGGEYRRTSDETLERVQQFAFGNSAATERLPVALDLITRALAAGDLVKAQLLGLTLPLPELDGDELRNLAEAAPMLKAYDPDEPRDELGRWTSEGSTPEHARVKPGPEMMLASAEVLAPGLASDIAPFLGRIAIGANAGMIAFGLLLIPFGSGNNFEGTLPGSTNIGYRFEEGTLSLYYTDADGIRVTLFSGRADSDGLYRDAQGHAIARLLDNGVGFVIDPDELPALAAKTQGKASDLLNPDLIQAVVQAYNDKVAALSKSEAQLCPPATPEKFNGSLRAALYQWSVCGMPPDWSVKVGGVSFDGCIAPRGPFEECKGLGIGDKMTGDPIEVWPWPPWYTTETDPMTGEPVDTGISRIVNQMKRQNVVAGELGTFSLWKVAEPDLAEWLKRYAAANGLTNIVVVYVPPPPLDPDKLRRSAEPLLAAIQEDTLIKEKSHGCFPWLA